MTTVHPTRLHFFFTRLSPLPATYPSVSPPHHLPVCVPSPSPTRLCPLPVTYLSVSPLPVTYPSVSPPRHLPVCVLHLPVTYPFVSSPRHLPVCVCPLRHLPVCVPSPSPTRLCPLPVTYPSVSPPRHLPVRVRHLPVGVGPRPDLWVLPLALLKAGTYRTLHGVGRRPRYGCLRERLRTARPGRCY